MADTTSGALSGRRILVLEARLADTLAGLVAGRGGEAVCVPAVAEVDAPAEEVAAPLRVLCNRTVGLVVLQTGVGAERLHRQAAILGLGDAYLEALRGLPVAVRGPKPTAALAKWGIRPTLAARSPYTTGELCAVLAGFPLSGTSVFVQHYGEMNRPLCEFLMSRGATPVDALPYRWGLPEPPEPLRKAVDELERGEFDALLVTSRPQVRSLFEVAESRGSAAALRDALNSCVAVAAVGPVARGALEQRGVRVQVEPRQPKMVPLVDALAAYFAQTGRSGINRRTSGGAAGTP